MIFVLLGVFVHDIRPFLRLRIGLPGSILSQIPVDISASRIDSWSKLRLSCLLNFFHLLLLGFGTVVFFAGLAHVEEFAVDQSDLALGQTKGFAIYELF